MHFIRADVNWRSQFAIHFFCCFAPVSDSVSVLNLVDYVQSVNCVVFPIAQVHTSIEWEKCRIVFRGKTSLTHSLNSVSVNVIRLIVVAILSFSSLCHFAPNTPGVAIPIVCYLESGLLNKAGISWWHFTICTRTSIQENGCQTKQQKTKNKRRIQNKRFEFCASGEPMVNTANNIVYRNNNISFDGRRCRFTK